MIKGEKIMVDVKYVDEQLKVLAKRSKEQSGSSEWTGMNEFIYNNFTASRIVEFSETVMTLQTAEEMLTNLEENLNQDDYSILQKENADDRVVLYIQTATHLSPVGNGAIITVVLNEQKRNIEDDIRKNDYLIYQYENRIKKIKDENITLEQKRQDFILLLDSVTTY